MLGRDRQTPCCNDQLSPPRKRRASSRNQMGWLESTTIVHRDFDSTSFLISAVVQIALSLRPTKTTGL